MSGKPILLEVCVDSAEGLEAAISGGADRIELCSALELGGLTPSPGLMAVAARASIPVYAMIRPRAGDFVFSPTEIDVMHRDIGAVRAAGLAGVVLGASAKSGALDEAVLEALSQHASGLGRTLHRAIDLVPDLLEAVDLAVELKFERILSSGGDKTALQGLDKLAAMQERANGRISVMPGSGIQPQNAMKILSAAAFHELHASCGEALGEADAALLALGFATGPRRDTSLARVRQLRAVADQFGAAHGHHTG